MIRRRSQSGRPLRGAAAWVAFLCVWMATFGVARHTERFAFGASHQPTSAQELALAGTSDQCAACEWTQAMQVGGQSAAPAVLRPWADCPLIARPADRPILRPVLSRPSRAPPAALS